MLNDVLQKKNKQKRGKTKIFCDLPYLRVLAQSAVPRAGHVREHTIEGEEVELLWFLCLLFRLCLFLFFCGGDDGDGDGDGDG